MKKVLLFLLVGLLIIITFSFISIVSAATWDSNLNRNLTHYWDLNDGDSTNVLDIAIGLNGTKLLTIPTSRTGLIGGAYEFSGIQTINYSNTYTKIFSNNNNWSINLWINLTSGDDYDEFITSGQSGDGSWALVNRENDAISITKHGIAIDGCTTAVNILNKGKWGMVTVTVGSDGKEKIYVNGTLNCSGTLTQTYSSSSSSGNIGSIIGNLKAWIDEIGVWNRTLNSTEITQLYNSGVGIANPLSKSITIVVNSPVNNTILLANEIIYFNTSMISLRTLSNATLYIDNVLNETKTISGYSNQTIFSKTISSLGTHQWYINVCDSGNGCTNSSINNVIIQNLKINSVTYNNNTYETASENFALNVTGVGSALTANLIYDGTTYAGTNTGTNTNAIFTRTLDIPLISTIINKTFYWTVYYETIPYNSSFYNQSVNPITFTLCNSTINITYINYTFLDEATGLRLNASIDLLTENYGLASFGKQYLLINATTNPSYAFCFSPQNKNVMSQSKYLQYSSTGYPQRHYYSNETLTNLTTNKSLYLLATSSGIYSSIQTANNIGSPITGVEIIVERQFGGVWTLVEQGTTDNSGLATFWLNPNYDHRYTATKTGYATSTVLIRPTQSTYTIIMSNAGASNITYVSAVEGVHYTRTPASGLLNPGTNILFTYNITATKGNMVNCRFDLTLHNGTILETSATTCTSNAYLTIAHTMKAGEVIYGKYYVDMGGGWLLIESDGNWRVIATNSSSSGTLTSFLKLLGDRTAWGVPAAGNFSCFRTNYNGNLSCEDYGAQVSCEADTTCFWGEGDEARRWEFTIIVSLFLFLAIFGAATNIGFQYDLYNPGYFLWIVPFILLGISMAGQVDSLTNPQGLLYIQGATFLPFFDNYIIAIYAFIIMGIITLRSGRTGS